MRVIVEIIKDICQKEKIVCNSFSKDWLLHLQKGSINRYIIGYDFELNSSAVNLILKDKAAMSALLKFNNIFHVEHKLFMTPARMDFVGLAGNWQDMINYAKKNKYRLVCKYNFGSGGNNVIKVTNQIELEKAVHHILSKENYICLSKYYDIEEEYRAIYLEGEIKVVYKKERPFIIGDGKSTLKELLAQSNINIQTHMLRFFLDNHLNLDTVYKAKEKVLLNWKHNLGQGSLALIEQDKKVIQKIEKLINSVINILDIKFASFDIIKVGKKFLILEINAGIMMEKFATQSEANYKIAYKIYKEAVYKMFK